MLQITDVRIYGITCTHTCSHARTHTHCYETKSFVDLMNILVIKVHCVSISRLVPCELSTLLLITIFKKMISERVVIYLLNL